MHLSEFRPLNRPFPSQNYIQKQASAADLLDVSLFETPITENPWENVALSSLRGRGTELFLWMLATPGAFAAL